ncbi:MAG: RpoL/Rpb11 RNA polymerase subunit family protein [Candidatus Bathyarchaeia archaeon]
MKLEFLKKERGEWEIKITGEGHTLLNLLQEELLKDDRIDFAAYVKPHPLVDFSTIRVRATGGRIKGSFLGATRRIREQAEEFEKVFEDAEKRFRKK